MIRTLVVDDDFRVAAIHAAYVNKVDGFQVIAEAHTAAEAVDAVDRLRPDLMLLDLYLPDEHGLKLVSKLRSGGHPPVDVIVITAAKDADSVRVAMQGGALHYLLKPFSFPVLRDKLLSYAQMRTRLDALREADQRNVDRVFGALRAPDQLSAAKGRSVHTLEAVEQLRRFFEPRRRSLVQVAIAWVLAQVGITSAIVGASRPEQLDASLPAIQLTLDAEEREACNLAWFSLPRPVKPPL